MAMTFPPWFRPFFVRAHILALLVTGCGSAGEEARADAGQNATLDAAGDGSAMAPLPSTGSLFLTIDNMEERNGLPTIPANVGGFWWPLGEGGGLGNWFFASAGGNGALERHADAVTDSIVPPRADSTRARHLPSSTPSAGADLYAQLKHPSNGPVDLTGYLGISFWAKLGGPSQRLIVAFRDDRGEAILSAELTDSHFAQTVSVSETWERFILLFEDFRQGVISGKGSAVPFTAKAVSTIDFVVGLNREPFDLWIDDLALLCRGVCPVRSF